MKSKHSKQNYELLGSNRSKADKEMDPQDIAESKRANWERQQAAKE